MKYIYLVFLNFIITRILLIIEIPYFKNSKNLNVKPFLKYAYTSIHFALNLFLIYLTVNYFFSSVFTIYSSIIIYFFLHLSLDLLFLFNITLKKKISNRLELLLKEIRFYYIPAIILVFFIIIPFIFHPNVYKENNILAKVFNVENRLGKKLIDYNVLDNLLVNAYSGDREAQSQLCNIYYVGEVVFKNYFKAKKWCLLSAAKGVPNSEFILANIYYYGLGIFNLKNRKISSDLFKKLAEKGDVRSQYILGLSYATGDGIKQDLIYAYMWLSISIMKGNTDAPNALKVLEEKMMTSNQVNLAIILTQECIKKNYEKC